MSNRELLVPARYYTRLADVLAGDGIDLLDVLRRQRISPALLSEPDGMLRLSQVDRLLRHVAERSGRTDLAYELGKLLTASAHSFVGFGMLNSETLDQALRFEARYFRLVMPSFRMRYTSTADRAEMYLTPLAAMSRVCLNFHLEAIGLAALRELADLTGDRRPPCRLDLSMPEPSHAQRYARELRDVAVRFGVETTPGVRITLLEDPRSLRLAMADSNARRLAEARCRALVQRVTHGGRFADWVAMTLREVADELPSLEEMAGMLNISRRTLNRYLEHEGTSFRDISGGIQHELACERLAGGTMSVTEVAYSLGFSDRSNFSRAFRARAGCSPGRYAAEGAGKRRQSRR